MSEQLEPGKAELEDVPDWLWSAHALVWRRWRVFLTLTVLYFGLSLLTQSIGYWALPLGFIVALAFVMIGILAAKHADDCISFDIQSLIPLLQKNIDRIVVLSLLVTVITFAALALGSWLLPVLPEAMGNSIVETPAFLERLITWLAPGSMRFFIVVLSVTISGMWFLLPLCVFHSLSMLECALLSKRAETLNLSVILLVGYTPLMGTILILLLHDIGYVFITVAFPYFAAVQYVSYRHVFMRRKQNSPERAISPSFITVSAEP